MDGESKAPRSELDVTQPDLGLSDLKPQLPTQWVFLSSLFFYADLIAMIFMYVCMYVCVGLARKFIQFFP